MKTKKNRRTVGRSAREWEIRRAKDYTRLKEWSDSEATIEKSGGTNVHSECWPAFTYCIVRRTTNCVAPVYERGAQANLTLSFYKQLKFRHRSFFHSVSSTWLIFFSLSVAYRTRSVVFKSEKPEAVHMSRGSISSWQDYGRRSCKWLKIAFLCLIQFPHRYFPSIIYAYVFCSIL